MARARLTGMGARKVGWYRCALEIFFFFLYFLVGASPADTSTNSRALNSEDSVQAWLMQARRQAARTTVVPTTQILVGRGRSTAMQMESLQTMVRVVRSLLRDLEEELKEKEAGGDMQERPEPPGAACRNKQRNTKLRTTHVKQPKERRATHDGAAWEGAAPCEVRTGAHVVVKVRDCYYGRHGTVMGKKGNYFWDVKLDAVAGKPACVIYKKGTSLAVVE
jgi:hypothetical protein